MTAARLARDKIVIYYAQVKAESAQLAFVEIFIE